MKMAAGKLPGEDDFLGLAGLANFFVGDDADGHGFAGFGGAGDGERGLVVVGGTCACGWRSGRGPPIRKRSCA